MKLPEPAIARRSILAAALLSVRPLLPAHAVLDNIKADQLAQSYANGERGSGGRGASAMSKARTASGVNRIGPEPTVSGGSILDTLRSADGTAVDVSFAFPEKAWSVSTGPNLDVRDVIKGDSAFVLAAALPKGKSLDALKKSFFTDVIFSPDGKYGAYGTPEEFSIKDWDVKSLSTPSGGTQPYRQFSLSFEALTYNANTVVRRAKVSATAVGGTVFVLVAGCLGTRYKETVKELESIQASYRAYTTKPARAAELEAAAAEAEAAAAREFEDDDMAKSGALEGTVGSTSVGRIGYRPK